MYSLLGVNKGLFLTVNKISEKNVLAIQGHNVHIFEGLSTGFPNTRVSYDSNNFLL